MREGIKLVAFDLDGVLVDGGGSWVTVHQGLGTLAESQRNGIDYFSGKISFGEWAKKDVSLWKGVGIEKLKGILYTTRFMDGIEKTIPRLKKNYKLAIISGGLKLLAQHVQELYDIDYCYGNELLVRRGKVAGIKHTVDFDAKGSILRRIAQDAGISTKECAAVGDYLNDIPMFREAGYSIAFDPKSPEVAQCASQVVYEKNLARLLDYL